MRHRAKHHAVDRSPCTASEFPDHRRFDNDFIATEQLFCAESVFFSGTEHHARVPTFTRPRSLRRARMMFRSLRQRLAPSLCVFSHHCWIKTWSCRTGCVFRSVLVSRAPVLSVLEVKKSARQRVPAARCETKEFGSTFATASPQRTIVCARPNEMLRDMLCDRKIGHKYVTRIFLSVLLVVVSKVAYARAFLQNKIHRRISF